MIKNATKPTYFPEKQEGPCENNKLQAQVCFRTWRSGFVAGIAFWFDASFGTLAPTNLGQNARRPSSKGNEFSNHPCSGPMLISGKVIKRLKLMLNKWYMMASFHFPEEEGRY